MGLNLLKKSILYGIVAILGLIALGPIVWTLASSIKNKIDIISMPPVWVFNPTLDNYRKLIETFPDFPRNLWNTVITSVISTSAIMVLALLAAYGVSRFRFWWRGSFLLGILVHRMIPEVSIAIPFYLVARHFGLYDSLTVVILSMIAVSAPFAVWLLMGFVEKIPRELEESALVDGCSHLSAFVRITVPLMLPGLAVTFIFCFLLSWNLFLLPLILTSTDALTLAPLVVKCSTEFGVEWGPLTALATILFVPLLVLGAFVQKYLVSGLTLGALKG
jgi:multiple sugar transport system permease protein